MRYVLSHLIAGTPSSDAGRGVEGADAVDEVWRRELAPHADLVGGTAEQRGRLRSSYVMETDRPLLGEAKHAVLKGVSKRQVNRVVIEPVIRHHVRGPVTQRFAAQVHAAAPAAGAAPVTRVAVRVTGGGTGLTGVTVTLVCVADNVPSSQTATTDASGRATFQVPLGAQAAMIYAIPREGFWSMTLLSPPATATIDCPPLPRTGPLGWWHEAVGITTFDPLAGAGITIGVVDTGVGKNQSLSHVIDAGAFVNGRHAANGADVDPTGHGTMICGTIGARAVGPGMFGGCAPGATLYSACAYVPPGDLASQVDVANAIDAMALDCHADLVNLSLFASEPSSLEEDAITAAQEAGTLCICAAGNVPGGAVQWPAAFASAIAVGAVGRAGCAPTGVADALFVPQDKEFIGPSGIYLASLSCSGPNLAVGAPGVALIATVPETEGAAFPFGATTGTSCAAAVTTGVLAAILGHLPDYRALPPGAARAAAARTALMAHAYDVGLPTQYVGHGLPMVTPHSA